MIVGLRAPLTATAIGVKKCFGLFRDFLEQLGVGHRYVIRLSGAGERVGRELGPRGLASVGETKTLLSNQTIDGASSGGRPALSTIMTSLTNGDVAAVVALIGGFGSELESCISRILGQPIAAGEADELVQTAALAVMDVASQWPSDHPSDFSWAEPAIRARLKLAGG